MVYVTIASVRRTVGIASDEISDDDVTAIIAEVEPQIERYYNTVFVPKERIDIIDGNGTNRIFSMKNPLLNVRELKIDGTTEDPANLHIYKGSGKIILSTTSTASTFLEKDKAIVIKYLYGWLVESSTSSTTSADEVAGTDVSVALDSTSGFADNDWVEIYGMDGFRETAQINGTPGAGAIVLDQLVQTHDSGSTVVKIEISPIFEKLMNIVCALAMVARIVGESYTDIVGYSVSEFQLQKGEPFTQWRETAKQLIQERDDIMKRLKARPVVI